jgi:hypothetical protein
VVLQVGGKDKGKRRALLVSSGSTSPLPKELPASTSGPAYEPMSLEGDVLERMRFDPEVIAFRRRFVIGLASVFAVLIVVVIWHSVGGSVVNSIAAASSAPAEPVKIESRKIETKTLPANTVAMRRGTPTAGSASLLHFDPPSKASTDEKLEAPPVNAPTTDPAREIARKEPSEPKSVKGVQARANEPNGSKQVTLAMTDPRVQAAAALERFLLANNIDAMLATVADRSKVEPKIRSYLETHPLIPLEYQSLTISNGAGPTGERSIVVILKDGTTREAVVVREDDRSVVDWPSFVAYSDMEWAQFMEKKPADPVLFRVIATPDKRFDNSFADAKGLTCLKLSDPRSGSNTPLFAYVESASIIGQEVAAVMSQAEGEPRKLTLHLKYPNKPTSQDQVWIDSVVASGWMLPRDKTTAQVR